MARVGTAKLELSTEDSGFFATLNTASDRIKALGKDADHATRGLQTFGAGLASVGVGIAAVGATIAAAGAGLFALTKSVANQGDELFKMSQKVGISVEELSDLKVAAELSDVSMEQLGTVLGKLSVNMEEARAGTGEAADAFKRLGIAVELEGKVRPVGDVLADLADKLSRTTDAATRNNLAAAILGKSYAAAIPFLNEFVENLEEARASSDALGTKWSTETAKAAQDFNDRVTKLGQAFQGLARRATEDLLPVFSDFAKQLTAFVASDEMRQWAKDVGAALIGAAEATKNLLQWLHLLPTTASDKTTSIRKEIERLQALAAKAPPPTAWEKQIMGGVSVFEARIKTLQDRLASLQAEGVVPPTTGETPLDIRKPKEPFTPGAAPDKGAESALKKLQEQDIKGWVDAIEAMEREDAAILKLEEQRWAEYYKTLDEAKQRDTAGWVAYADTIIAENEREAQALAQIQADYWREREATATALRNQEVANELESLEVEQEAWKYHWQFIADEAAKSREQIQDAVNGVFEPFSRAFTGMVQGVLEGTQTLEEGFKRMGQNILATLVEDVINQGLKKLAEAIVNMASAMAQSNSAGGGWAGLIQALGQAFGSARADGGPVSAFHPYFVGEEGVELFVPRSSGDIIPHDRLGATTNVYVDARGSQRGVSAEVMAAIRNGMGQAVNLSVARVQDARRRGGMRGFDR